MDCKAPYRRQRSEGEGFVPLETLGQYAEVLCDATIAWPIIVKAALERMAQERV